MTCPKCKAKIGMVHERITTETGQTSGKICYICGYWAQEHSRERSLAL